MNTELKALISTAFDIEKLAVDGIKKNYFALFADALALMNDAPGDIAGFSGLQAEINDLSKPANEQDLALFIQQKFSSNSDKAQRLMSAIVAAVSALIAVEQAFVS